MNTEQHKKADTLRSSIHNLKKEIEKMQQNLSAIDRVSFYNRHSSYDYVIIPENQRSVICTLINAGLSEKLVELEKEYEAL